MKKDRCFLLLGVLLVAFPSLSYAQALPTATGDISNWLYNLATQVPAMIKLVVAIAYISGFAFLVKSIMLFKHCAKGITMAAQSEGISGPLIYLLVGVVLIYFAGFVQVGSVTLFGTDAAIAYQSDAGSGPFSAGSVFSSIVLILRLIGYISFVKGLYILASLAGHQAQKGTLAKGIIHVMGGILAINIEVTYSILLNTLVGGPGIGGNMGAF
jgi:intracellular multiplication protein IcmC